MRPPVRKKGGDARQQPHQKLDPFNPNGEVTDTGRIHSGSLSARLSEAREELNEFRPMEEFRWRAKFSIISYTCYSVCGRFPCLNCEVSQTRRCCHTALSQFSKEFRTIERC